MWRLACRLRGRFTECPLNTHRLPVRAEADSPLIPSIITRHLASFSDLHPFLSSTQTMLSAMNSQNGPQSSSYRSGREGLKSLLDPSIGCRNGAGASLSQVRSVHVDVVNGDVDRALKRYKWKLRDDNSMRMLRARRFNYKPAELKVLLRKESEIRRKKQMFKEKLNWIMSKRSRGF